MHCISNRQDFRSSPEGSGRAAVIPKLREGSSNPELDFIDVLSKFSISGVAQW